jgi:hypothetical protein
MPAPKGGQHWKAKATADAREAILNGIKSGLEPKNAAVAAGVKVQRYQDWLWRDKEFAEQVEQALAEGKVVNQEAMGDGNISFSEFSRIFLESEVFPHHQDWIDVLEGNEPSWIHDSMIYEPSSRKRLLVNVPPEHAKSSVITVNYALYRICMNPSIKIAIVSQTQKRAKEFLFAIKQRLTEPRWAKLQQVYGPAEGWRTTADQWTQDQIYLKRDSEAKDPTVQALGAGQQIYGTRADLIILDDIVSTTNAHEWEKQLEWIQKMVITRLGAGSLIIVGTRVSANDLYKELRNEKHWTSGKSPFTYLAMPAVLEFHDKPSDWVTLWPRADRPWDGVEEEPDSDGYYTKWDGPTLYERRGEVSANTWALVYQQQDVEEDAIFPAAAVSGSVNRARKTGPLNPKAPGHPQEGEWVNIMGLDPAMSGKTAAIMYSYDRLTGKRLVLDAHNMGEPTPQKIRGLIENWVTIYQPMEIRIEINAFQKAFSLDEDLRNWLGSRGCQLREHFTGRNKWDVGFGVAAMSALFGTVREGKHQQDNLLSLPSHENNEHVKALINQLITWKSDTRGPTDLVMALWFCEIRAQELVRQGMYQQTHMSNRWATKKNRYSQSVVNLDDYGSDNYIQYL